jgi:hypothetical protein
LGWSAHEEPFYNANSMPEANPHAISNSVHGLPRHDPSLRMEQELGRPHEKPFYNSNSMLDAKFCKPLASPSGGFSPASC